MINYQYKNKSIIIALVIVIAAAALGMSLKYLSLTGEIAALKQQNKVLEQEKMEISELLYDLEKKIADMEKWPTLVPNEAIIEKLTSKGLSDIEKDLVVDLNNNKNLIKHPPVLGGTMHFNESGIYVLTDKWVLAEFEDGHIFGYMLLKYEVNNGKIQWKVIESYLF